MTWTIETLHGHFLHSDMLLQYHMSMVNDSKKIEQNKKDGFKAK